MNKIAKGENFTEFEIRHIEDLFEPFQARMIRELMGHTYNAPPQLRLRVRITEYCPPPEINENDLKLTKRKKKMNRTKANQRQAKKNLYGGKGKHTEKRKK